MLFLVLLFLYLFSCKITGWLCEIFAEVIFFFIFIEEKGVSLHRRRDKT